MSKDSTPLMRQYWEIKNQHQDKILLFRMGDFFEIFHEDAKIAAPILGIALTSRNKKALDETPMCGVPHHSIAGPINKLLRSGYRVAICDQLEDPAQAKGIVKRGVTRVLTPGMVYDPDNLNPEVANYIACFDPQYASFVDTSSGEAFFMKLQPDRTAYDLLSLFPVVEFVLDPAVTLSFEAKKLAPTVMVTPFQAPAANNSLNHSDSAKLPASARLLQDYVVSLSGEEALLVLRHFEERVVSTTMRLSSTVYRHLEFFSTYRGEKEGSLFWAIDRTRTSSGARLLKQWMCFPLIQQEEIESRLNQVASWIAQPSKLKLLRELMIGVGDLERRLGKVALPQANARDLRSLASSLLAGLDIWQEVGDTESSVQVEVLRSLAQEIDRTLLPELPISVRQGGLIKSGIHSVLDEWVNLAANSQQLLQKMEEREKEATGISSLKIRYNNVFGYYIEITHLHKDKVPSHYLRKQTLANAERFCTPELLELEKKVLSAEGRRSEIEYTLFSELRAKILSQSQVLQAFSAYLAHLDVILGLSWLAIEKSFCRPQFVEKGLALTASKHPVVEAVLKNKFVANSLSIPEGSCLLLTGPNMAGKSTLMRQVAIVAILGQMGSYVPASEARQPLFDAVFTRVGASDLLSEGLSTFMVEMTETAEMLKKASSRSLVILDEIGRGTSTYDGLALAQSILEHLVSEIGCTTLFATHYHEMSQLAEKLPAVFNAHMSVVESRGHIEFLHTLKMGPAGKSYGIQVGKLAGMPKVITDRAQSLLRSFEEKDRQQKSQLSLLDFNFTPIEPKPELVPPTKNEDSPLAAAQENLLLLKQKVEEFSVLHSTPLKALEAISSWQDLLVKSEQETEREL